MLALLYRRVSTGAQNCSLISQEEACTKLCQEKGWQVQDFPDSDTSGTLPLAARDGGSKLLDALRRCNPKDTVVVAANQDRLGRDVVDIVANIRRIWDSGVDLYLPLDSGNTPFNKSSSNDFMLASRAAASNYEINRIRERIEVGLRTRRQAGRLAGTVPYGWDVMYLFSDGWFAISPKALFFGGKRGRSGKGGQQPADGDAASYLHQHGPLHRDRNGFEWKRLVRNAVEQNGIDRILSGRAAGNTLQAIADDLNRTGCYPTKLGGEWTTTGVDRVLTSNYTLDRQAGVSIGLPCPWLETKAWAAEMRTQGYEPYYDGPELRVRLGK